MHIKPLYNTDPSLLKEISSAKNIGEIIGDFKNADSDYWEAAVIHQMHGYTMSASIQNILDCYTYTHSHAITNAIREEGVLSINIEDLHEKVKSVRLDLLNSLLSLIDYRGLKHTYFQLSDCKKSGFKYKLEIELSIIPSIISVDIKNALAFLTIRLISGEKVIENEIWEMRKDVRWVEYSILGDERYIPLHEPLLPEYVLTHQRHITNKVLGSNLRRLRSIKVDSLNLMEPKSE